MPNTKSPRLIALEGKQFADETYLGDEQTASNSSTRNGSEPLPAVLNSEVDAAKNENGKSIGPATARHSIDDRSTTIPIWPMLSAKAYHGIAGEIVALATQDSEVDPAAVLLTTLVYAGAEFGSLCYLLVGEIKHPPRFMAVLVGASSRARKGTSTDPVARIFKEAEKKLSSNFQPLQVSQGPLSSGEGLVFAIRDESEKKKDGLPEDAGVIDKRLLVIEGELGAPLKAMQRDGNTLSLIIKAAWDHGNIAPLTKSSRIKATGAHINTWDTLPKTSSQDSCSQWMCGMASRIDFFGSAFDDRNWLRFHNPCLQQKLKASLTD